MNAQLKLTEIFMSEITSALNPVEDRLCFKKPPGEQRDALLVLFAFCLIDRGVMALEHLGVPKRMIVDHVSGIYDVYAKIDQETS